MKALEKLIKEAVASGNLSRDQNLFLFLIQLVSRTEATLKMRRNLSVFRCLNFKEIRSC
jgi:hypothetical protein